MNILRKLFVSVLSILFVFTSNNCVASGNNESKSNGLVRFIGKHKIATAVVGTSILAGTVGGGLLYKFVNKKTKNTKAIKDEVLGGSKTKSLSPDLGEQIDSAKRIADEIFSAQESKLMSNEEFEEMVRRQMASALELEDFTIMEKELGAVACMGEMLKERTSNQLKELTVENRDQVEVNLNLRLQEFLDTYNTLVNSIYEEESSKAYEARTKAESRKKGLPRLQKELRSARAELAKLEKRKMGVSRAELLKHVNEVGGKKWEITKLARVIDSFSKN